MRFIIPVILIGIAITGFFMFVKPIYSEINGLKEQIVFYDEALNNSKALEAERDKLVKKYNNISPENLEKIKKMLPDTVDNIRLILEIEKMALPFKMALKDIKYDAKEQTTKSATGETVTNPEENKPLDAQNNNKDYGTWELEFSTQGNYFDFLSFLKKLEKNLRIVDIVSIQFSSGESATTNNQGEGINKPSNVYKYGFKIRTYWLKN